MLKPNLHIVLVEPEIHWNTGNAGRTCLALGAKLHLVKPLGFSLDEKQVRRAGLDYWPKVDLQVWEDWGQFERALPTLGQAFLISPDGEQIYWQAQFPQADVVLLFGSETKGFRAEIRQKYRHAMLNIPITEDAVRSLNVSTCVGIAGYEVLRQWHQT